jgi:hypothetical protein
MKLVLKSFAQEIDVASLDQASNYLVFEDEGTGRLIRIPVYQETITALSGIIFENDEGVEEQSPEPKFTDMIPEVFEKEELPPEVVAPPARKTLRNRPMSEDEVPQL